MGIMSHPFPAQALDVTKRHRDRLLSGYFDARVEAARLEALRRERHRGGTRRGPFRTRDAKDWVHANDREKDVDKVMAEGTTFECRPRTFFVDKRLRRDVYDLCRRAIRERTVFIRLENARRHCLRRALALWAAAKTGTAPSPAARRAHRKSSPAVSKTAAALPPRPRSAATLRDATAPPRLDSARPKLAPVKTSPRSAAALALDA